MAAAAQFGPMAGLKSVVRYGAFFLGLAYGTQKWYEAYDARESHFEEHLNHEKHEFEAKQQALEQRIAYLEQQNQRLADKLDPEAFENRRHEQYVAHVEAQKSRLTFDEASKSPEKLEQWAKQFAAATPAAAHH